MDTAYVIYRDHFYRLENENKSSPQTGKKKNKKKSSKNIKIHEENEISKTIEISSSSVPQTPKSLRNVPVPVPPPKIPDIVAAADLDNIELRVIESGDQVDSSSNNVNKNNLNVEKDEEPRKIESSGKTFAAEVAELTIKEIPSIPENSNKHDITVSVDIHRPRSDISDLQTPTPPINSVPITPTSDEKNNNVLKETDKNLTIAEEIIQKDVPETKDLDLTKINNESDSDDCSTTTKDDITNNIYSINNDQTVSRSASMSDKSITGTQMSVKIKRKQYIKRKSIESEETDDGGETSSFDEFDDPVYEKVEYRMVSPYLKMLKAQKSKRFKVSL